MKSAILKFAALLLAISTMVTSLPIQASRTETGSAVIPGRYKEIPEEELTSSKTWWPIKRTDCETDSAIYNGLCNFDCFWDEKPELSKCPQRWLDDPWP